MAMQNTMIFLPVLLQALLTILVYLALGAAKSRAMKNGLVDLERRALYNDAWPENVQKINNNIRNQFEVPVLFYVVVIVLWLLEAAGALALLLAWLFVASRIVHAYIHLGSNYVPARRAVFTFGVLSVMVMLGQAIWAVLLS